MTNTIKCPKCGHEFPASEGLMEHLKEEASQEVEKKLRTEIENEKSLEVQDLKKALQEKDGKINDFREKELKLLGDKRKLEDEKKDLGLEVQRKLDEGKGQIEEKAYQKANEDHKFKDLEKEKLINDLKKSLEDVDKNGLVIMLLRLNFFGSKERFPFFDKTMPHVCYVHQRRMKFSNTNNTDSIEYCHCVWIKNNYSKFAQLRVI